MRTVPRVPSRGSRRFSNPAPSMRAAALRTTPTGGCQISKSYAPSLRNNVMILQSMRTVFPTRQIRMSGPGRRMLKSRTTRSTSISTMAIPAAPAATTTARSVWCAAGSNFTFLPAISCLSEAEDSGGFGFAQPPCHCRRAEKSGTEGKRPGSVCGMKRDPEKRIMKS